MKSFKYLVLLVLILIGNAALFSQSSDWIWAKTVGGPNADWHGYASASDRANFIKCDANGNIYMAGLFIDTAYADRIEIPAYGDLDVMVARFDPSGKVIWATSIGSQSGDIVTGLALDDKGNAYVCGSFFGKIKLGGMSISSETHRDMFVAKISRDGVWQWIRQGVGALSTQGNAIVQPFGIVTDGQGNSILRGIYLGKPSLGSIKLPQAVDQCWFLAGIDSDGNWSWATSLKDLIPGQQIVSLAFDLVKNDHLIVVGSSTDPNVQNMRYQEIEETPVEELPLDENQIFEEYPMVEDSVYVNPAFNEREPYVPPEPENVVNGQIFLARYSLTGTKDWMVSYDRIYGYDPSFISSVITDDAGNIYFSGSLDADAEFGDVYVDGNSSYFLAGADSQGTVKWAKSLTKRSYCDSFDDPDSRGRLALGLAHGKYLYVVMPYDSFNPNQFVKSKPQKDRTNALIWTDLTGNYLGCEFLGSIEHETWLAVHDLLVDHKGDLYIAGSYHSKVSFGQHKLSSPGAGDGFVAKRKTAGK